MEALWNLAEKLDRTAIRALEKLDRLRKLDSYRARIEAVTKNVRAPQRAIEFDK